jgi:hypothetical protein
MILNKKTETWIKLRAHQFWTGVRRAGIEDEKDVVLDSWAMGFLLMCRVFLVFKEFVFAGICLEGF